jgi:predicted dehydrogenase
MKQLNVGIIGCGLIGVKRALAVCNNPNSNLVALCDSNSELVRRTMPSLKVHREQDWHRISCMKNLDIVIVSTPNALLGEIAEACLQNGKHVLIEKPMCRNLEEANALKAKADNSTALLKIGFNHRYHPGIREAKTMIDRGDIGNIINARIIYGHGGRPGYEKEWRGNYLLAGGGELTDQGVHVADLFQWFFGMPQEVFSLMQKAVWQLEEPLEDNAFGLFRFPNGIVASMHTSWTQWKNKFQFEIFGKKGSIEIQGLGGSYGPENLVISERNPLGGAPKIDKVIFEGPDNSWDLEWQDFIEGINNGSSYFGTPIDGIRSMQIIDGLYKSYKSNSIEFV